MRAIMLVVAIFVMFFFVLTMGVFTYIAVTVDDAFESVDLNISGYTFNETYQDTLGLGVNAIIDQADMWGMFLLFGMVLLMIICGYFFNSNQKLWIILEIFILVVTFIIAGVLQYTFNEAIHASSELLDIYSTQLEKSSTFILALPFIIPVIWLIMMIIVYGRFKRKSFEEATDTTQGVGF